MNWRKFPRLRRLELTIAPHRLAGGRGNAILRGDRRVEFESPSRLFVVLSLGRHELPVEVCHHQLLPGLQGALLL